MAWLEFVSFFWTVFMWFMKDYNKLFLYWVLVEGEMRRGKPGSEEELKESRLSS